MDKEIVRIEEELIQSKIYTIRGKQVMLDSDLAELYKVETRRLNEQVKRNIERFPEEFMLQLTEIEFESLRSQIATLRRGRGQHRKYLPFVFTEQGVAMLSAVLKSDVAVKISIQIMQIFIQMRKIISNNALIFQRMDKIEQKQLLTDEKLERVFQAIESKELKPQQGIFFEGQIFDAYVFVSELIKQAKKSIILIDNYVDETVLTLLTKRCETCKAIIYTQKISEKLKLDLQKHNTQYPAIEMYEFKESHDRFLVIDNEKIYHFGASLKDLGKKIFAFSVLKKENLNLLDRLKDS